MRFIHTADWQIGKPFRNFGERDSILRNARLSTIEAIGKLAQQQNAPNVLVAGDLYDSESPADKTLLEPLERMRRFASVTWHVIPGNHDCHRPNGVWDRVLASNLPANVRLHLKPEACPLGEDAVLLPAPLSRKTEVNDLTLWMDKAETAPGMIRIGLGHGSVTGFGAEGDASNPIAPDRCRRAGLSYLALGDWHRTMSVSADTWYSGTHEPDRFGSQERGQVLLVDIAGPAAQAKVTPLTVGQFSWASLDDMTTDDGDIARLDAKLRALPDSSSTVLRLKLGGYLGLAARADLLKCLDGLEAVFFHFDRDLRTLAAKPSSADLEAIDFGGVLREAAEELKRLSEDPSAAPDLKRQAENALIELYVMTAGNAAGASP